MRYLTADESLEDLLRGVVEPVEIRDATGRVLGHYAPAVSAEDTALYEKAKKLFDPAELERRKQTPRGEGYSFGEVLRHLDSLESKG